MNNIIVDNNKLCDDNLYIYQDIKSVEVLGTSTLNINANITDLNIIIRKGASLIVNYFNIIDKLDSKITIILTIMTLRFFPFEKLPKILTI